MDFTNTAKGVAATQGAIDLRGIATNHDFKIKLQKEWELYLTYSLLQKVLNHIHKIKCLYNIKNRQCINLTSPVFSLLFYYLYQYDS